MPDGHWFFAALSTAVTGFFAGGRGTDLLILLLVFCGSKRCCHWIFAGGVFWLADYVCDPHWFFADASAAVTGFLLAGRWGVLT